MVIKQLFMQHYIDNILESYQMVHVISVPSSHSYPHICVFIYHRYKIVSGLSVTLDSKGKQFCFLLQSGFSALHIFFRLKGECLGLKVVV